MISDHGASRLAVINNQELSYEMAESGKHSGRCCPKSETDTQPECATESDNYWVLANYGRFKGSRKGDVEVHGGATLEEVFPLLKSLKKKKIMNLSSQIQILNSVNVRKTHKSSSSQRVNFLQLLFQFLNLTRNLMQRQVTVITSLSIFRILKLQGHTSLAYI